MKLPYVILKSAMSIDGFIDDASPERLRLSNEEDFERVDQVRSECDAILVGGGTIRADNPSLLVKSEKRQQNRLKQGLSAHPIKVTLIESGQISQDCRFLLTGNNAKLIYCTAANISRLRRDVGNLDRVTLITLDNLEPQSILADLSKRGIKKILIEGGSKIATSFLEKDCVDELQVSIAPFFVGDGQAPRFVNAASFHHLPNKPMRLKSVEQFGDVVLLTYLLHLIG